MHVPRKISGEISWRLCHPLRRQKPPPRRGTRRRVCWTASLLGKQGGQKSRNHRLPQPSLRRGWATRLEGGYPCCCARPCLVDSIAGLKRDVLLLGQIALERSDVVGQFGLLARRAGGDHLDGLVVVEGRASGR